MLALFGLFVAVAFAQDDPASATQDDPASAAAPSCTADATALYLDKVSNKATFRLGQAVVYTVKFENPKSQSDTVQVVTDTLPVGFTFETMLDTGDVYTPPQIDGRTLTWNEPIVVPGGESRKLVYQVRAEELGQKDNTAEAESINGCLLGPASVQVTVNPLSTFIPMVLKVPNVLFLSDDFNSGLSSDWVVFTNWPGLKTFDWEWYGEAPEWGTYLYNSPDNSGWRDWALSMYLGSGAQEWTDYQVVTNMRAYEDKLSGLWVRGTYVPMTDMQGGRVGGYYIHLKPQDDNVYLWKIRPDNMQYHTADVVAQAHYTAGITNKAYYSLKVAVQGANIKVWMKNTAEAESAYRLLINWTDPKQSFMKGTVGFSVWRSVVFYDDITVSRVSTGG